MTSIHLIILVLITGTTFCQQNIEYAKNFLCGESSKVWHLESSEQSLSIDASCGYTIKYTFYKNGTLKIDTCNITQEPDAGHTWELKMKTPDINLIIDNTEIYKFNTSKSLPEKIRLRRFNVNFTNPTTDLIFENMQI